MEGYNLSLPLAVFLAILGFFLLRRVTNVSLEEIGRHRMIEHDASLVHADTPPGVALAPAKVQKYLVELLLNDAYTEDFDAAGGDYPRPALITESTVARARIRREKESKPLDGLHAEIARGEMGIILGVMEKREGNEVGVPVEWMRQWIGKERMPTGWQPTHTQGLLDTLRRSKAIGAAMEELRKAEGEGKKDV